MKYTLSLLNFLLLSLLTVKAQDTIYFKNGSKTVARIVEIAPEQISYYKFNYQEGPVMVELKDKLHKIVYKTGDIEVFSSPNKATAKKENRDSTFLIYQNIFSINFFPLVVTRVSLNFERMALNGHFGIWVPVSFTLNKEYDRYLINREMHHLYSVGLGLKWFPAKPSQTSFFVAPLAEYSSVEFNTSGNWGMGQIKEIRGITSGTLNIGVSSQITDNFGIQAYGGLGMRQTLSSRYNTNGTMYTDEDFIPAVKIGFLLSLRF